MALFSGGKLSRWVMSDYDQNRRDEQLRKFIAFIPDIIEMEEFYLSRRVFEEQIQLKSSHDNNYYEKIKSVFSNVNAFPLKELAFQFWTPHTITPNGRSILHTMKQPFAITPLNYNLRQYRKYCYYLRHPQYQYKDDPSLITPHTSAFENGFPEVVLDLNVYNKGLMKTSFVEIALGFGLTCCITLPVFDPSTTTCVGVVECCMKGTNGLVVIFNELKRELERVGLRIYHVQGSWPYKSISSGLKAVSDEIEKALGMVCELHDITLGQVWITYDESESESDQHVLDTQTKGKRMFLVKLFGYCVDSKDDPLSSLKDFYDYCDVLPLKMGEGLAGMTLESQEPHLCRNIHNLHNTDNKEALAVLYANIKCSCLVICLRSTHTRDDVDYVFEFFWPQTRNYLIVLESLLSTLKRCLPSFKFASGAQLGDELCVVDVSRTGIDSFKIFRGNTLSQTSKETSGVSDMKQEPLTNDINNKTYQEEEEDDDIPVLVLYLEAAILFSLPSSSCTLANLKEKIKQQFGWNPAVDFMLEFEAANKGELYFVHDDASLRACILFRKRESDKSYIKVRVK